MDEEGVAFCCFLGKDARSEGVDGVCQSHLRLSAIDGGVGGGVEDNVGRGAAHQSAGLVGIGKIDGLSIDGDDGAYAGEDAFQLAAKLAGVADDENAGISRKICGLR